MLYFKYCVDKCFTPIIFYTEVFIMRDERDLMYSKTAQTTFTQKASSLNVPKVSDGFGMLIGQAILSFELWRGVKPDFDTAIKKFRPC